MQVIDADVRRSRPLASRRLERVSDEWTGQLERRRRVRVCALERVVQRERASDAVQAPESLAILPAPDPEDAAFAPADERHGTRLLAGAGASVPKRRLGKVRDHSSRDNHHAGDYCEQLRHVSENPARRPELRSPMLGREAVSMTATRSDPV